MTSIGNPPASYYVRLGDNRYRPTEHAGGAWNPGEQHMGPVAGLIMHEIERFRARRGTDLVVSRITYDILGRIDAVDFELELSVLRPGRTIELLDAIMTVGGRPVVRARAWLLSGHDTSSVAGGQVPPLSNPDDLASWQGTSVWSGGFIASLDVRTVEPARPGRVAAWVTTDVELVAEEPSTPLARFAALIDTANGVAVRQPPTVWAFPNVDLSVYLYRQPEGLWVGLDTTVVFGADGRGLTTSVLHDTTGPVGRSEQILTVRRLPSPG